MQTNSTRVIWNCSQMTKEQFPRRMKEDIKIEVLIKQDFRFLEHLKGN